MPDFDLREPHRVPRPILVRYLEQLFAHTGDRNKNLILQDIDPYDWVIKTRDSYELWLSYAKIGIPGITRKLRAEHCRLTESTPEHKKYLEGASQEAIDQYFNWVFPRDHELVERWKNKFSHPRYLVSPLHFWFFMSCHKNPPFRPLCPSTTNALFRHPLLLISGYQGSLPLVVPEYFFNDHAKFDGLVNPKSASYYIFPYFAKRLFEYVKMSLNQRSETFSTYYIVREDLWFVPEDSIDMRFDNPDRLLRRYWRWEEVLEMLWGWKASKKETRPRWCKKPPHGYRENPQIATYLNRFAQVAELWIEDRTEPNT